MSHVHIVTKEMQRIPILIFRPSQSKTVKKTPRPKGCFSALSFYLNYQRQFFSISEILHFWSLKKTRLETLLIKKNKLTLNEQFFYAVFSLRFLKTTQNPEHSGPLHKKSKLTFLQQDWSKTLVRQLEILNEGNLFNDNCHNVLSKNKTHWRKDSFFSFS